jgi:membrane protease YdiL (CAAX protease family)
MDNRSLFFDDTERLRSGWRFVIFGLGFVFVIIIAGTIVGAVLTAFSAGETTFLIANAITALIAALLVGWLCGKYLESLPFRALGAWFTKHWLRNLIVGIVFGALTLILAVLVAIAGGGLQFSLNVVDGGSLLKGLAISLTVFATGAAWEEALFRGYLLQTLSRSGLAWLGIGLTSIFFGIIHTQNPNADLISTLNTMLAGVWFGVAYLKTRDLWFVWGMHLMWNWMQGSFFGIEVSGLTGLTPITFLKEIDAGPAWLTGESYGVEGGIVTTIALIVSTIVIWYIPFLKPSEEMLKLTDGRTKNRSNEKAPLLV